MVHFTREMITPDQTLSAKDFVAVATLAGGVPVTLCGCNPRDPGKLENACLCAKHILQGKMRKV